MPRKGFTWLHLFCFTSCALLVLTVFPTHASFREKIDNVKKQRAKIYSEGYFQEGKLEFERGNYLRAIRLLTDAIGKGAPTEAFKYRGQAYEQYGSLDKAVTDYNAYLFSNPEDYLVYAMRGDTYIRLTEFEKAFADFSRSMELNPSSQDSLVGRAISLMGLQKYSLAIRDLKEAIRRNPDDLEATRAIVIASMLDNNYINAKKFIERAVATEQDTSRLRHLETLSDQINSQLNARNSGEIAAQQSPGLSVTNIGKYEPYSVQAAPESISSAPSEISKKPNGSGSTGTQDNVTGLYETSYMGHFVSIQVTQSGNKISGVLRIRNPLNKEDNYTFSGAIENGEVYASHRDGGSFKGKIEMNRLVGSLRTNEGLVIPISIEPQ
ncbi:MAG: tetratricopeptide repeat protein [Pseudomonadota bacterium]